MSIMGFIKDKKDEFFGRKDLSSRTEELQKQKQELVERTKRREDFRRAKSDLRTARMKEIESRAGFLKKSENKTSFGRGFNADIGSKPSNSFGSGVNPAFSLGREEPKKEKKEGSITIKIKR